MVERTAFHANQKNQFRVSLWGELDCSAITNRMQIVMIIQFVSFHKSTLIKKNGGKGSFFCKSKASTSCNPMGRT